MVQDMLGFDGAAIACSAPGTHESGNRTERRLRGSDKSFWLRG